MQNLENQTNPQISAPNTYIVLYIQNRANMFMCIKQKGNDSFELPKLAIQEYPIAQTIELIATQQLGFTISPLDCRLKTVVEEFVAEQAQNIYIVYAFRLLKDVLLTSWANTQEMVFCTDLPNNIGQIDAQILAQLKK